MPHILLTEDDASIVLGLRYSLEQEGFTVTACGTAAEALSALRRESFDLLLLDLTLPDGSGYDVCREAKRAGGPPVIFLTACDDEISVVMGLDMGADDYITKPFRVRELISRIRSVLRRSGGAAKTIWESGKIKVNTAQAKVYKSGEEVALTSMEYRLLLTLINEEGRVISRARLLDSIWDVAGDFVNDNTLTVYIKRLREKLEDTPQELIRTVRGIGYQVGG